MKYQIRGKKTIIDLNSSNYITPGGQSDVYGIGNTIYKIYLDPSRMVPEGKIRELSVLDLECFLKPIDIILNNNISVGFTMNWIKDTISICKLFSTTFCDKNRILDRDCIDLVEDIKKRTLYVHSKKCLIVDGNELNYLYCIATKKVYFIDIDSYKTLTYPPDAINPSIQDFHSNTFSELTDWFSFAIIACQLLIKIHPYDGIYLNNDTMTREDRMKSNISIFNKDVRTPPSIKPIKSIPRNYLDWFTKVFEKGERLFPPDLTSTSNIANSYVYNNINIGSYSNKIQFIELLEIEQNILYLDIICNKRIIKTKEYIQIETEKYPISDTKVELVITKKKLVPIFVYIEDNKVKFYSNNLYNIKNIDIECDDFFIYSNELFLVTKSSLLRIDFEDSNSKNIIVFIKESIGINSNRRVFSNIITYNIMGTIMLTIPLVTGGFFNVRIKELDRHDILDAKVIRNVVILIAVKNNNYKYIVLIFSNRFEEYFYREYSTKKFEEINFILLDNGVVVSTIDNRLEIFYNIKVSNQITIIDNCNLNGKLYSEGNKVLLNNDNKIYQLKIK